MRVRRDVTSIPYRSASETWEEIISLVTGPDSVDAQQLKNAAGVLGSIITDEHPARRAIVIEGVGAQLRIYCCYGMQTREEGGKTDPLTWNPTAGDWTMHVPCDAENMQWVKSSLSRTSGRIKLYDVAKEERSDEEDSRAATKSGNDLVVDWDIKG